RTVLDASDQRPRDIAAANAATPVRRSIMTLVPVEGMVLIRFQTVPFVIAAICELLHTPHPRAGGQFGPFLLMHHPRAEHFLCHRPEICSCTPKICSLKPSWSCRSRHLC